MKRDFFKEIQEYFTLFCRAIQITRENEKTLFNSIVGISILQGFVPVAISYFAKLIIDELVSKDDFQHLIHLSFIEMFLVMLLMGLNQYNSFLQYKMRERLWHNLSEKINLHASKLDLDFFESPENYNNLTKAQQNIGFRPVMMTVNLMNGIRYFTLLTGFSLTLISYYPLALCFLLLALIPTALAARDAGHITFASHDMTTQDGRRAAYYDGMMISDGAAKELRLFDLSHWFIEKRGEYSQRVISKKIEAQAEASKKLAFSSAISQLAQYFCYIFAISETFNGRLNIGDFSLVVVAITQIRSNISLSLAELGSVFENSLFIRDLLKFLDYRPKILAPQSPAEIPTDSAPHISVENISFTYEGSSQAVFENLTLNIKSGRITAIVGANGAGKTTLVKLLTRLYDPQKGSIKIEGIDIKSFDPIEYRRQFGVIMQDFIRYQLTLKENIIFGNVNSINSDIFSAVVKNARVEDFATMLPKTWETVLGRQFDPTGQALSGGQWQRVALARALYRNASILILDEPTSALDPEAELEVIRAYQQFMAGKTCLLISHRLNAIKDADYIFVLDRGKIIEEGNHKDLMDNKGKYYSMYNSQADSYKITEEV